MIEYNMQAKRYGFFIGMVIICLVLSLVLAPYSQTGALDGLKNLVSHHNLIDTDTFYIAGYSGAFLNTGLTLAVALIFFALTKTQIGSLEMAGLGLVFGYSFYGKNFLAIIPIFLGVYLYQAIHKKDLSAKSAMACFAASLVPVVTTTAFHTPALNPGSALAIIFAIALALVMGMAVAWVSNWMGDILKGRSILLGAASAGPVALVVAGLLRSFGLGHEPYVDPAYMDQAMYMPVLIAAVVFGIYYILAGLAGGARLGQVKDHQTAEAPSADLDFADGLLNTGILWLLAWLYFAILPTAEMHGEIWAGVATMACFTPRGLTLRYTLPFHLGMVGFNFISSAVAGALAGESFISAGLAKIGSRASLMGTFVGSNIAPLNQKIDMKRGIIMGILYALVVVKVSALHDQMLLYNSGFALALTVILFNVADHNSREKLLSK